MDVASAAETRDDDGHGRGSFRDYNLIDNIEYWFSLRLSKFIAVIP
jgi:hypothetical protein